MDVMYSSHITTEEHTTPSLTRREQLCKCVGGQNGRGRVVPPLLFQLVGVLALEGGEGDGALDGALEHVANHLPEPAPAYV
jgi:hypothetical protein